MDVEREVDTFHHLIYSPDAPKDPQLGQAKSQKLRPPSRSSNMDLKG